MSPRGSRLTPGGEADARNHWNKSKEFAAAARAEAGSAQSTPAYSSAILSVIHAADAIAIRLLGHRSSSQDHLGSVELLDSAKGIPTKVRETFIHHLRILIAAKSLVQYSADRYDAGDAAAALEHMERALAAIEPLAREWGWK